MPHLIMVLAQMGYTLLNFITEASLNHGMSPYVYVTYRHVVARFMMLPFAYLLERYVGTAEVTRVYKPKP